MHYLSNELCANNSIPIFRNKISSNQRVFKTTNIYDDTKVFEVDFVNDKNKVDGSFKSNNYTDTKCTLDVTFEDTKVFEVDIVNDKNKIEDSFKSNSHVYNKGTLNATYDDTKVFEVDIVNDKNKIDDSFKSNNYTDNEGTLDTTFDNEYNLEISMNNKKVLDDSFKSNNYTDTKDALDTTFDDTKVFEVDIVNDKNIVDGSFKSNSYGYNRNSIPSSNAISPMYAFETDITDGTHKMNTTFRSENTYQIDYELLDTTIDVTKRFELDIGLTVNNNSIKTLNTYALRWNHDTTVDSNYKLELDIIASYTETE